MLLQTKVAIDILRCLYVTECLFIVPRIMKHKGIICMTNRCNIRIRRFNRASREKRMLRKRETLFMWHIILALLDSFTKATAM